MSKQNKELPVQLAQGELLFVKMDNAPLPSTAGEIVGDSEISGRVIVGHSETGHHHTIDASEVRFRKDVKNPLIAYLEVMVETALEHSNPASDSHHAPLIFSPGLWEVHYQADETPSGWQLTAD